MKYVRFRIASRSSDVWPIIYIDLMTQIMMFFVILWSIARCRRRRRASRRPLGDTDRAEVNLPGDVLFPSGKTKLTVGGRGVFAKLFEDDSGEVLKFDTGGLTKRVLVIHGHTDSDGDKDENFVLGFQRAMTVYQEIQKYGPEIVDHAVMCTHADNSPAKEVPLFTGHSRRRRRRRSARPRPRTGASRSRIRSTAS